MPAKVSLEIDDSVATLTMSSDRPVISLTDELVTDFEAALDQVEAEAGVRCVVLTGSGKTFLAGADLKEVTAMDLAQKLIYNQRLIDITNRLEGLPQPVIAAINGAAFGGGLEFALACSIRVADADAVMGLPEVKLGIVPGSGGTVRLPRLIQVGTALRLLFSGAAVSAEEALQIGIVDQVAPAGEALTAALELAAKIASRAPLAVQLIKASVRDDAELSIADAAQEVQGRLDALMRSADATEGIAAFVEKRPPNFKGE